MFNTKMVRLLVNDLQEIADEVDCNRCHCLTGGHLGTDCVDGDPCLIRVAATVLLIEANEQDKVAALINREFFREEQPHADD